MILSSLLLLASTLHAGPERPLIRPVADASPYSQELTAVEAGDETALLVWMEERRVLAARLDRDGRRVDAQPLLVEPDLAGEPAVARGAGKWLVAWSEWDRVSGRFVSDDGTVGERLLLARVPYGYTMRLAFDGRTFLIAGTNGMQIHVARVDANGVRLANPTAIDQGPTIASGPLDVAAFDGGGFAVTSYNRLGERLRVETLRFDANGVLTGREGMDETERPVASMHNGTDGASVVAVWATGYPGNQPVLHTRSNEPLAEIPPLQPVSDAVPHGLARVGGRWVALIEQNDLLRLVALDGSGERILAAGGEVENGFLTSFGDRLLVAATVDHDLYATVLDGALADVAPLQLFAAEPALQDGHLLERGSNGESLAVWNERRDAGPPRMLATRLDAAGRPLGGTPVILGAGLVISLTSDGAGYFLLWRNDGGLVGQRLTASGTPAGDVLPVLPVGGGLPFSTAVVCGDAAGYTIASLHVVGGTRGDPLHDLRVMRVTAGGTIAPASLVRNSPIRDLTCAAGLDRTLVVWQRDIHIEGAIVGDDGTSGGTIAIGTGTSRSSGMSSRTVAAARANSFAVAWFADRAIHRSAIGAEGTPSRAHDSGIDVTFTPVMGWLSLAESRGGYVLTWELDRIYAVPLDASALLQGEPAAVSTTPVSGVQIAGGDIPILLYARDTTGTKRWRLFTRTLFEEQQRRRAVSRR